MPALTAAYVRQTMRGIPGLASLAVRRDGRAGPWKWAAALARRRRDRLLRACERVLVASADERAEIAKGCSARQGGAAGPRHRPVRFAPTPGFGCADRLARQPDRLAVLFVGRVDLQRIIVLAEAIRLLRDEGYPVHLVVAGSGSDAGRLPGMLGDAVTLLGPVPQDRLARIYAGCDVLAFPSRTETVGNVVAEAMACGLPVLLPAGARTSGWLQEPGKDGVLVADDTPGGWAAELARLVDRRTCAANWPSTPPRPRVPGTAPGAGAARGAAAGVARHGRPARGQRRPAAHRGVTAAWSDPLPAGE